MKGVLSAVGHLIVGLNVLATTSIFLMTVFVVADVVSRVLFNYPLTGVPELAKLSLVAITFLQIPYVMLQGRHIRSTVLFDRFPPVWRKGINLFTNLIGVLVFIMIFYGGWDLMVRACIVGEYEGEGALRVTTIPSRIIIELGSALMIVICSRNVGRAIKALFMEQGSKEIG